MHPGFYWIRFLPDANNEGTGWLPAEFSGPCDDGSPNESPWTVIGSDDVYPSGGIEVLPASDRLALLKLLVGLKPQLATRIVGTSLSTQGQDGGCSLRRSTS